VSFGNSAPGLQRAVVVCRGKTAQSITSWTTLTNWIEIQDLTNSFDPITGIFVAPRTGIYAFSVGDGLVNPVGSYIGLSIVKNGVQFYNVLDNTPNAGIQYKGLSGTIELAAGDSLSPRAYHAVASNDAPSASNSWFTITEVTTIS
jgi:C1q domain